MRTVGKGLIFGLLISLMTITLIVVTPYFFYWQAVANNSDLNSLSTADRSIVYPLRIKPTEFVLSRPSEQIRILSNGAMRDPNSNVLYALGVQALDEDGNIILDRTFHLRSNIRYVRGSTKLLLPAASIRPRNNLIPSAGDATIIMFPRPVTKILLREVKLGDGVGRILARVQEQRPVSERQIKVGWQRLAPAEKEEISAGSPLGHAMLTEAEKQQLLISRWNPVGPSGVEGRDYLQVMLYERTEHSTALARRSE